VHEKKSNAELFELFGQSCRNEARPESADVPNTNSKPRRRLTRKNARQKDKGRSIIQKLGPASRTARFAELDPFIARRGVQVTVSCTLFGQETPKSREKMTCGSVGVCFGIFVRHNHEEPVLGRLCITQPLMSFLREFCCYSCSSAAVREKICEKPNTSIFRVH
jgi:hypothetical protein